MKIYCVDYFHDDDGRCLAWVGSKREADVRARELRSDHGDKIHACKIEEIDFPTDKAGLIQWLNWNLTERNG